jgi:RimJ/RimL family protein N-acetyltransferase
MITTPRLLLRPWQKSDLKAMAEINADARVMEFFPSTQTEEQTKEFIGRQHLQQQERGHCYFATELQESGRMIGFIGISYQDYDAHFTPCVDIGWRLHPDVWGQGLATEGAKACLDFAFQELKLPELVAVAVQQNIASTRVMEKIGMSYDSSFDHPVLAHRPDLQTCVLYYARPGE